MLFITLRASECTSFTSNMLVQGCVTAYAVTNDGYVRRTTARLDNKLTYDYVSFKDIEHWDDMKWEPAKLV